ncbi:MAG: sugar phosphate isomerase/epimerase [Anaerolineae bacterium]|nr:sugar phosphate isomerase/epimerase [Anaerolineae bacterium]
MERIAIATHQRDIAQHVAFAQDHHTGIEIQIYGYDPNLLDGDWPGLVARHKSLLRNFAGEIALHGVFYDMNTASIDRQIVALTRKRYLTNLHIASELGARHVVFHANYLHVIRNPGFTEDWTRRQVDFFGGLIETAQELDVVITLENMWEPRPDIIASVIEQVDSPHLAACLDVGHAHLYSDPIPFTAWLERLSGHLVHCHINNHRGLYDEHLPLNAEMGIVDYDTILPMLWQLPQPPLICLEMDDLGYLERSLGYMQQVRAATP